MCQNHQLNHQSALARIMRTTNQPTMGHMVSLFAPTSPLLAVEKAKIEEVFVAESPEPSLAEVVPSPVPEGSDYVGGRLQKFAKVWKELGVHP